MSYYDNEEDEESLFERMMKLRDMIADVPREADIVSAQTRQTVDQISREIGRVLPPKQRRAIRRVPQPELPATAPPVLPTTQSPELPATTSPQLPAVTPPAIPQKALQRGVYGNFAGRRRKMPNTLNVFLFGSKRRRQR